MKFVTVDELKARQKKWVLESVYHRVMAHKAELLARSIEEQLSDYEGHLNARRESSKAE